MKFKILKNLVEHFSTLAENSSTNVAAPEWNPDARMGDDDASHMYPEKECNRDRLNFWLKTLNPSNKPIFDVREHLINIRMKMNLAGYEIPVNHQTELSDHMEFKITQFGGRQGMNDQGQVFKDDGISHKNNDKGLKLVVNVSDVDGSKMIETKIEEE